MTSASRSFRIGVEAVLPAEDWWCTIYGRMLGEHFTADVFARSLRELGADFTLFYDSLAPRLPDACKRIAELCGGVGIDFLFNNTYGDIYGPWQPGTGRAEYGDDDLACAAASGRFKGVILDEMAHRQIHQIDTGKGPYLADVAGRSLPECYELLLEALGKIADRYRSYSGATVAELVFPVMAHVLARAGVVPAPKFLAESFSPVFYAICMGAALQYGTEMWVVHDFWGAEAFWAQQGAFAPGFSPETYRASLLLAYWLGVDAAYTEGIHNLISLRRLSANEQRLMAEHPVGHRGGGESDWIFRKGYALNAYGKIHRWFATHYVPTHPRGYSFRDLRPKVAIVRFPDTCWQSTAQPGAMTGWFKGLYGPGGPDQQPQHTAWLDLWHVLTHGVVPRGGVSLFCEPYGRAMFAGRDQMDASPDEYDYREVYPFCPLDGVAVFDHRVTAEHLVEAELICLTGEMISPETQQAVLRCVQAGADCIALPHLSPAPAAETPESLPAETRAGKGRIMLTDDFCGEAARRFIARHLGPDDMIRYRFADQTLAVRPCESGRGLIRQGDNEAR